MWEKVDRVLKQYKNPTGAAASKALDRVVSRFRFHASMVFQRFLDEEDDRAPNIKMTLNGSRIAPWDPFMIDHPGTEVVADQKMAVQLPDGPDVHFRARAFVLPRREELESVEEKKAARLENKMQGIYIYREHRLIHFADWLRMFSREPHFTLSRVEFSFNHELDDAFQVDIKKSRIELQEELYEWLRKEFLPAPRRAAEQRYRKGQKKKIKDLSDTAHTESDRAIGEKSHLGRATVSEVDEATGSATISNDQGSSRIRIKVVGEDEGRGIHVHRVDSLDNGLLWEPAIVENTKSVALNTGHPYYSKVYVPNYDSSVTVQGLDSLLWALVQAELVNTREAEQELFADLRFEVSRLLRKLVAEMPEPKLDDDDS